MPPARGYVEHLPWMQQHVVVGQGARTVVRGPTRGSAATTINCIATARAGVGAAAAATTTRRTRRSSCGGWRPRPPMAEARERYRNLGPNGCICCMGIILVTTSTSSASTPLILLLRWQPGHLACLGRQSRGIAHGALMRIQERRCRGRVQTYALGTNHLREQVVGRIPVQV